jgi:hypothetical protein
MLRRARQSPAGGARRGRRDGHMLAADVFFVPGETGRRPWEAGLPGEALLTANIPVADPCRGVFIPFYYGYRL